MNIGFHQDGRQVLPQYTHLRDVRLEEKNKGLFRYALVFETEKGEKIQLGMSRASYRALHQAIT